MLEKTADEEKDNESQRYLPPPVKLVSAGGAGNGDGEDKGQGIEKKNLQIETHCGMLGENHRSQYQSGYSACQHQYQVVPPEDAVQTPFHQCDYKGDDQ